MTANNPVTGVVGNVFQFLLQNFCPPLFPFAGWWNRHAPQFLPHALVAISTHFDTGFFQLGELPTEDSAGIGLGLSVLLWLAICVNFLTRKRFSVSAFCFPHSAFLILPWLALLAYSAKSGMTTASRLIAPYYPLLLPLILIGSGQCKFICSRVWKILIAINLIFAFVILILTPDRPLWPAQAVLSKLAVQDPNSHLIARAQEVYSIYAHRADPLAEVRELLPANINVVGFIGGEDDCDISLWLPLGSRRVEHFFATDSAQSIRQHGIQYVVIGEDTLLQQNRTITNWLQKSDAELVGSATATLKISAGPQQWFVVQLKQ